MVRGTYMRAARPDDLRSATRKQTVKSTGKNRRRAGMPRAGYISGGFRQAGYLFFDHHFTRRKPERSEGRFFGGVAFAVSHGLLC